MTTLEAIRPATEEDYTFIKQLWKANTDTLGSMFTIREYIKKGTLFVIPNIGFVAVDEPQTRPIVHISMLAVSPNARGGGYGRTLIEYVKQLYPHRTLTLDARVGAPNNKFYEKIGFVSDYKVKCLRDFDVYTYNLKQRFTFDSFL